MGRFHRHEDGTVHDHEHEHEHGDHSHYGTGAQRVEVLESIFAENDLLAEANRKAFDSCGVRAVNLMSSPGAGKTTILQATLDELAGDFAIGVIEGDIATDLDAAKLAGRGAQISLLNTGNGFGGECHLDAPMVDRALRGLDLPALLLLFWLMRRMTAARMTLRFVLGPLIASLAGVALFAPTVSARAWLGLALMAAGSAWMLLQRDSPEDSTTLSLR